MPACDTASHDVPRALSSRLCRTLLHLEQNLKQTRETEELAETRFAHWQSHWSYRRRQITQQLDSIDERLESLYRSRQLRPQFGVIGSDSHDETCDE